MVRRENEVLTTSCEVQVQYATKSANIKPSSTYAIAADFCRIFADDIDDLYVLALLLTGHPARAEECVLSALDDCYKASGVFKDWARKWARRAIVLNAIRLVQPAKHAPAIVPFSTADLAAEAPLRAPLTAILKLGPFERFVFVLSVLEKYSEQEVKTLLDRTRQDVVHARTRAIKNIAAWGQSSLTPMSPATATYARAS
jgi:DNA-directed RNA polymerase specialized sigma24 family protein